METIVEALYKMWMIKTSLSVKTKYYRTYELVCYYRALLEQSRNLVAVITSRPLFSGEYSWPQFTMFINVWGEKHV